MSSVAFDIDGTLLNPDNTPNYRVIDILLWFVENNDDVFIWSGGGMEYAERIARRLGLHTMITVIPKDASMNIDLTFDDQDVTLGKVNIRI